MPRDAAAEEASLFGHAPVAPDATAAYGEHPDQVVDFHLPRDPAGPAPLVILFHGGAWRAPYDRHHLSPFAAYLAERGLAVALPEYRRGAEAAPVGRHDTERLGQGPQGTDDGAAAGSEPHREHPPGAQHLAGRWPETFDDIAAVVDRVPRLVGELGLGGVDAERVVLAGHSAGGHAALWAAARHRLPPQARWHLPAPPPLRGVVALAPIADLTAARALRVCSDAVDQLLGDRLAARLPLADPAALLPTGVPTVLVQGGTDVDVPPQVADSFAAAGAVAGEPPRVVRIAAVGHFPLIDPATAAARTVADEIARAAARPSPS
ncbi:alpha/beta hydrolase [Streptomyces sp. Rer75]|uniref:alpha/beta hydrolase n=1 Tax=unclassified Streptomyces TaxID=2593676 RepID=UPI0015D0AEDB|nr:alpha/beta hydrolase [Streptomyces sp. Rer75]QLH23135.1 alpha/beta hydrolase [Streptomyces sp. Rer75]